MLPDSRRPNGRAGEPKEPRMPRASKMIASHRVERLETRRLFAVSMDRGVVTVTGSDDAQDVLVVWNDGAGHVVVSDNGNETVFDASTVTGVVMSGGAMNDDLEVMNPDFFDIPVTLNGGAGDDTLGGGNGNDVLCGDAGCDILFAGGGNDRVSGGDDNDYMDGSDGNDTLDGGNGDDVMGGGNGDDVMTGGAGNDVLFGEAGNDSLSGGDGDDAIDGGDGADTLSGGLGDDTMDGGVGADTYAFGDDACEMTLDGTDTVLPPPPPPPTAPPPTAPPPTKHPKSRGHHYGVDTAAAFDARMTKLHRFLHGLHKRALKCHH
jgi:hypothetical protein